MSAVPFQAGEVRGVRLASESMPSTGLQSLVNREAGALAPARAGWGVLVSYGLILVAHAPFLALYFSNLWSYHPHYEFFPLILATVAVLVWRRWPGRAEPARRAVRRVAGLLLGLGLVALAPSFFFRPGSAPWPLC